MPDDRDIPPEDGKRAHVNPRTGEVHGSGSGAGGFNPGEDFDDGPGGDASLHPLAEEGRSTPPNPRDDEGKTRATSDS